MRYHWGLGVGHYHAHQGVLRASENSPYDAESPDRDVEEDDNQSEPEDEPETANGTSVRHHGGNNDGADISDASESDDGELGLDDRHQEGWEDVESELEDGEAENFDGNSEPEDENHTGM